MNTDTNKDEFNKMLGSRIRWARKANKMTLDELADKMGYSSRSAISHIEHGDRSLTTKKVQRFARVLRVDPMWIIGLADEPSLTVEEADPLAEILKKLNEESKEFLLEYAQVLLKQQERFYGK